MTAPPRYATAGAERAAGPAGAGCSRCSWRRSACVLGIVALRRIRRDDEPGAGTALAAIAVGTWSRSPTWLLVTLLVVLFVQLHKLQDPGPPGLTRTYPSGGLKAEVRLIPAARPFAATTIAIFRDASSIISSPSIAAPTCRTVVAVLVRVQDQLGVVVVGLVRREHLVGRVDLARVQHPLAVVAERGGPPGRRAEPVDVAGSAGTARRSPAPRAPAPPAGSASAGSGTRRPARTRAAARRPRSERMLTRP